VPITDAIRQDPRAVGRAVLAIGGRPGGRPAGLDDRLDRDLGIGSLERVELLLRLERRFGSGLAALCFGIPIAILSPLASAWAGSRRRWTPAGRRSRCRLDRSYTP